MYSHLQQVRHLKASVYTWEAILIVHTSLVSLAIYIISKDIIDETGQIIVVQ